MTRVKICGLTRREDVDAALEAGADLLGFVLEPSSPRYVGQFTRRLAELTAGVPVPVGVFGLRADLLEEHWWEEKALPDLQPFKYVQFVYEVSEGTARGLLRALGKAGTEGLPSEMQLVDSAVGGGVGGTGRTGDWRLATEMVRAGQVVVLAGGLTPENVGEAVRIVRPFGVDVSSGVESAPGIKDRRKLRAFVEAVREAERP